MPDQGTEKHPEKADTTRDRHHPPQTQDSPPVPTKNTRLPLALEQPPENAEQALAIHASTGPTHATRKRGAPLSAGEESGYKESGYEADSSSFGGLLSKDSASQVCLCQPEPKIPRPRNGESCPLSSIRSLSPSPFKFRGSDADHSFVPIPFILFRQHHQAAVAVQHPGLSNPEISKIIGKQWRDISVPEKNQWKNLAEVGNAVSVVCPNRGKLQTAMLF
ncbi:hypothetical protein GP486_006480 [Trichoglossum hirsutum]|uniref:HMG box domain-containing protein n=1 Tax=Trichoglossum hirsutum TaxID=265104 RepID=A0A9P8I811_9PEZI|nr:hypothetical protein GP486_006480 [Trichoglossum hirsutum]